MTKFGFVAKSPSPTKVIAQPTAISAERKTEEKSPATATVLKLKSKNLKRKRSELASPQVSGGAMTAVAKVPRGVGVKSAPLTPNYVVAYVRPLTTQTKLGQYF